MLRSITFLLFQCNNSHTKNAIFRANRLAFSVMLIIKSNSFRLLCNEKQSEGKVWWGLNWKKGSHLKFVFLKTSFLLLVSIRLSRSSNFVVSFTIFRVFQIMRILLALLYRTYCSMNMTITFFYKYNALWCSGKTKRKNGVAPMFLCAPPHSSLPQTLKITPRERPKSTAHDACVHDKFRDTYP